MYNFVAGRDGYCPDAVPSSMMQGQNYNLSKKEDAKVPQCPLEKESAIMEALKHFQMI